MKLESRIQNIKTLLEHCPHSTTDVMLYDEDLSKFFWEFFSSRPARFETPAFEGKTNVRIHLVRILDKDYINEHNTICFRYCCDYDRDNGEEWTIYYFNDPECYFKDFEHPDIEYSEIPDNIWEKIQKILYTKAKENISKELEEAKKLVRYWKNKDKEIESFKIY